MLRRLGKITPGGRGMTLRHIDNPVVWPFARGTLARDAHLGAMVRDTVAITVLRAGEQPNVVPGRATAVLDCRLLPGTKEDHFLAALQQAIGDPNVRVRVLRHADPSAVSSTRNPLYRAIEASVTTVQPRALVAPFLSVATTDSRFFRARKVPAFGFNPVFVPAALLDTIHGKDERIPLRELGPGVRIVYETLRRL
jgi:carboxypeptidase PM20D1